MPSVTLAQMKAVEALARTGKFSRAAEDLGISQPSVSTQVQSFEELCRTRVFIRDGHNVSVAPSAMDLIAKIRVTLKCLNEVDRVIADTTSLNTGTISIGFSAHRLIMPVLTAFVRQFPSLRLTTRGGPSLELADAVLRGELDVATISQVAPDSRFSSLLLHQSRVAIYGRRGDRRLEKGRLALADLDGQDMVLWNKASGTRTLLEDAAGKLGIGLRPVLEVATLDVAYAAAAAGIGLAISIEGEVSSDDHIEVVPLVEPELAIGHYLVTLPECRDHAAIQAFFDVAKEHAFEVGGGLPSV
ncbi:LysR family transcriptional regulator [Rhizobium miluonense]|uniref:DNA-binding transcriptional regulator, LysR family n=1 Tax=Rhizobium miluonense TaxID=411945 RepID=A0A1C3UHA5_9HYPH|nr:LysR family transcriptional regulator [Rhizobium miluonense]SCB14838.1 DNA-binding transcriptional regulator, LysR family [Rhizobium miluonense]